MKAGCGKTARPVWAADGGQREGDRARLLRPDTREAAELGQGTGFGGGGGKGAGQGEEARAKRGNGIMHATAQLRFDFPELGLPAGLSDFPCPFIIGVRP